MKRRSRSPLGEFRISLFVPITAAVIIVFFWNLTTGPDSHSQGDFQILSNLRLVEDLGNDGDSFRIQHRSSVETYQLYFAYTCEKSDHFTRRLGHQGRNFIGLIIPQLLKLGHDARETTLDWLRHQTF